MVPLVYLVYLAIMPRIQTVTPEQATIAMCRWMESGESGNPLRRQELRNSMAMYALRASRDFGAVGVRRDGALQAVALLERVEDRLLLWNIEAGDQESGSLLVRTIRNDPTHAIVPTHMLSKRWKVAFAYFSLV